MEGKRQVPACMSFNIDLINQMVIKCYGVKESKESESRVKRDAILYRVAREGLFKTTFT